MKDPGNVGCACGWPLDPCSPKLSDGECEKVRQGLIGPVDPDAIDPEGDDPFRGSDV